MTLKHIDFYDSSVMRELARREVAKGTIKVAEKRIEERVNYEPSEDLFLDMVRLCEALRSKGLVSEAEVLEKKVMNFKRAAVEFSADLNAAHPDGNVEMGEAKDQLAEVETLEGAHEKILEVVMKKPTGKHAQLLNVVKMILKEAQPAATPAEPTVTPAGEAPAFEEKPQAEKAETVEDFFSDKRIKREKNVDLINESVVKQIPAIVNSIEETKKTILDKLTFMNPVFYQGFLTGNTGLTSLYAHYAQVSADDIVKYFNKYNTAYGSKEKANEEYLFSKINSSDSEQVAAFVKSVAPDVDIYKYIPKPPTEEQLTAWQEAKEVALKILPLYWIIRGGKWVYNLEKNSQVVQQIFKAVKDSLQADYNRLLSAAVIKSADMNLKNEVAAKLSPLDDVIAVLKKVTELDRKTALSNGPVSTPLSDAATKLNTFLSSFAKDNDLNQLEKIFSINIAGSCQTVVETIGKFKDFVNSHPLSTGDVVHDPKEVLGLAQTLYNTAQKIAIYAKNKFGEGNKEAEPWMVQATNFLKASEIISSHKDKQINELLSELQGVFPVKSYDELKNNVNGYSAQAEKLASSKNALEKNAQLKPPTSATVPAKYENPTGVAPGSGKPAGSSGSPVSPEEKTAVQGMQSALQYLSNHVGEHKADYPGINNVVLIQVGKGPQRVEMDGLWGSQTSLACAEAQKVLNEWNKKNPKNQVSGSISTTPMIHKGAEAVAAAKSNEAVIYDLIRTAFGATYPNSSASKLGKIYDKIRRNCQFAETDDIARPIVDGDTPLAEKNLSSLYNLFLWLKGNGYAIKTIKNDDPTKLDEEGIPYEEFLGIIIWLTKRAKYLYNVASEITDEKTRTAAQNSAAAYHAAAYALWQSLFARNTNGDFPNGFVTLTMLTRKSVYNPNQKGQSTNQGFPPNGQSPGFGAGVGGPGMGGRNTEGVDISTGIESPPISFSKESAGNIDLGSQWFHGFLSKYPDIPVMILKYRDFSRMNAVDMASALFGNSRYFNNANTGYSSFLNDLQINLSNAVRQWSRSGPSSPAQEAESTWLYSWQEIIRTQQAELPAATKLGR